MKKLLNYIKVIVSVGLISLLLWLMRDKLPVVFKAVLYSNKPLVALSAAILFMAMIMQSFRLKYLLGSQDIILSAKGIICLTFVGHFFNNFLPTTVGGDVVKAYYASNATRKRLETFASVLIDRLIGLTTLMWIAMVVVLIRWDSIHNRLIPVLIAAMFFASTFFSVIIFNKGLADRFKFIKPLSNRLKLTDTLRRFYKVANGFKDHKLLLVKVLLLSTASQFSFIVMSYFLARAMYADVPFVIMLVTVPAMSAVSMLPSINGLGIREGALVYFLGDVMGKENAFALSLLWLGLLIFASLFGGLIFLFKREFRTMKLSKIKEGVDRNDR